MRNTLHLNFVKGTTEATVIPLGPSQSDHINQMIIISDLQMVPIKYLSESFLGLGYSVLI